MLTHHSRSYGKYTAWALGRSAKLAHSAAAHSDEIRNADHFQGDGSNGVADSAPTRAGLSQATDSLMSVLPAKLTPTQRTKPVRIARKIGRASVPDSWCKLRHILVGDV